jgi:D-glycero-D-manno-heptose 1,7-bisphosphate phosphatase
MTHTLVTLDRDGTLIDFVRDPELGAVVTAFHPSHLRLLPGVVEGLRLLADRGCRFAIATNQPGAAKGEVPASAIERTHNALVALLAGRGVRIDAVEACLHHPTGGPGGDPSLVGACSCRKPAPGMLLRLAERFGVAPERCFHLGDTLADVEAAHAAGFRSGLLLAARCELCPLVGGGSGHESSCRHRATLTERSFEELAARVAAALD